MSMSLSILTSPLLLLRLATECLKKFCQPLHHISFNLTGVAEILTLAGCLFCFGHTQLQLHYHQEIVLSIDGIILFWLLLQVLSGEIARDDLSRAANKKRMSTRYFASSELYYQLLLPCLTLGFIFALNHANFAWEVILITSYSLLSLARTVVLRSSTAIHSLARHADNR